MILILKAPFFPYEGPSLPLFCLVWTYCLSPFFPPVTIHSSFFSCLFPFPLPPSFSFLPPSPSPFFIPPLSLFSFSVPFLLSSLLFLAPHFLSLFSPFDLYSFPSLFPFTLPCSFSLIFPSFLSLSVCLSRTHTFFLFNFSLLPFPLPLSLSLFSFPFPFFFPPFPFPISPSLFPSFPFLSSLLFFLLSLFLPPVPLPFPSPFHFSFLPPFPLSPSQNFPKNFPRVGDSPISKQVILLYQ